MNVTNFQTYVKLDFKRTDKDTEILQAYNDSLIAVAVTLPMGAYKYQSYIPLVARQEDYPLPSTIMHLIHPIRYLEGSAQANSGWPLNHITKEVYDKRYPNPNRTTPDDLGTPSDYTIYSGSILIGPMVSATEVTAGALLEINWTVVPTDLSGSTDLPTLPDYWREVLKQMTLHRVYRGIELFQEADWWKSQYEDAEGNPVGLYRRLLEIEENKEQSGISNVRPNNL